MMGARSSAAQLGIRAASPLAVVVGVYLLFAGHNNPGGGFAAGLVFGAVLSLRTIAGLQGPTHARRLISGGLLVVTAVAAAPLFWGDTLLDQQVLSADLPLLSKMKSGSALPFDIGVTAIVVGLIAALLDGLGEQQLSRDAAASTTAQTGGEQ